MGSKPEVLPRALSNFELSALTRVLELTLPADAMVVGVSWPGDGESNRNYRLSVWASRQTAEPQHNVWLVERRGSVYRIKVRPANADEIQSLLEALREVSALEPEATPPIVEADYDCSERTYQVCFTALENMREGAPYKRWILRRHRDGRPLSVGYVLETRRGNGYATLPGGATLRGSPWTD
jgi:hypothetical protein